MSVNVQHQSLHTEGLKLITNIDYQLIIIYYCLVHLLILMFLQDPNWYKAKSTVGREGTIPANYVQKREGVKSGGKLSLMP